MTVNANKIFVAAPIATGAVYSGAAGVSLPTDADASISSTDFTASGYVSEDGISISPTWDTTSLKDMSGSNVKTILNEFNGEVTFALMEFLGEESMKQAFGASAVTKTAATTTAGEKLALAIGASLPAERAWVFDMKDGDKKVRVCLPRAQVVAIDTIEFVKDNSANYSITLNAMADSAGKSIYIHTNDGAPTSV